MKSTQHTFRFILLFIIFGITLGSFPRINRTKLQHTYNFCQKTATFDQAEIDSFRENRKDSNLITVSLDKVIEGDILGAVSFKGQFFITVLLYSFCFIGLCVGLRRLSKYNNSAIKSSIRMSQELNGKGNNKKNLVFKGLVLCLLLLNAYNAIMGLNVSAQVEKSLEKFLCGFINIPNNFARTESSASSLHNYTSFNDYQYEVMSLRQLFNEANFNLTDFLKQTRQNHFMNSTHQLVSTFSSSQHGGFIKGVSHTLEIVESLIYGSKFMGKSLNYLRQVLYWIKGGLVFGQNFLNYFYSIEKLPKLLANIIAQTYQIMLFCVIGIFCAITFMSLKTTSKQGEINKYIILSLSFCTLLCLNFSTLGTFILPIPKQACKIIGENPNKAILTGKITAHISFAEESVRSTLLQLLERISRQSDGNMAFTNPEVYLNIQKLQKQIKILSEYKVKDVQKKLILQQPQFEKEIQAFFKQFPNFLKKISEINSIFDKIASSISKQGNFGRLTLRPFGEYIQTFEGNLCDVNLSVWSNNTSNFFICGVTFLLTMICFALYLRNKLKGDYLSANDQDQFQLTAYGDSEEKIIDG